MNDDPGEVDVVYAKGDFLSEKFKIFSISPNSPKIIPINYPKPLHPVHDTADFQYVKSFKRTYKIIDSAPKSTYWICK